MPKIQKNCARLDIKTGRSLICIKARKAKKMGSCPKSKGAIGQKPTGVQGNKIHLKTSQFLASKHALRGPNLLKKYHGCQKLTPG